jgi:hypothetical protein
MYCYPNFPGDDDERLFDMQFRCYSKALWIILEVVRERYLYAESVLRCPAPMSVQVRELRSIDHRTVQDVHDLIAAWYRFTRRTERLFPLESELSDDWCAFLATEVRELCLSAKFVTGVLDACIYANKDSGYAGEERAGSVQRERYSQMIQYAIPRSEPEGSSDDAELTSP